MKCISWNIDSLNAALLSDSNRAQQSREVLNTIKDLNVDIIAIQETKLPPNGLTNNQLEELKKYFPNYTIEVSVSTPPAKKGYSGTMILYKNQYKATKVIPMLGMPSTMDNEGRIITLEFNNFYFVNVYTPNAGDGLKRLAERQQWDIKFNDYIKVLDNIKPVISCGDFNVAHQEIDLANSNGNHYTAGFTDEEREGFTNILNNGFIDTFRFINGEIKNIYSWWSQRIKTSKINNSGWRIDYFIVSDRIKSNIVKSEMINSGDRADHTPIYLEINI